MTITELIEKLEAVRAEHGDIPVLARRYGDYLEARPCVFVDNLVRLEGDDPDLWHDPELHEGKPVAEASAVVYIEH